jgi:hypothetical protein
MRASHVFVETNWVVACYAPAHLKVPAALELLKLATDGSITLHVPGICLSEACSTIRRKFQPRSHLDPVRSYLRWAKTKNKAVAETEAAMRRLLDTYENEVLTDLEHLEQAVGSLRSEKGVKAFSLTEEMLEKALALGLEKLELQPFDNSILAAILTRASELEKADPDADLSFCELDSDLRPWDSDGNRKPTLAKLYDEAPVWVYGDFTLTSPARPKNWPKWKTD